ncbi:MAG: tetratricopeptide repeat protein [Candidatus Njordarchaeales archaeon]
MNEMQSDAIDSKEALLEGFLSFLLYDYEKAENLYEMILTREPDNIVAVNNLAIIYLKTRKYKKALKLVEEKLRHLGKNEDKALIESLYILKIILLSNLGNIRESINTMLELLKESIYVCNPSWELLPSFEEKLSELIEVEDEDWSKIQRWLSQKKKGHLVVNLPISVRQRLYNDLLDFIKENKLESLEKAKMLSYLALISLSLGRISEAKKFGQDAIQLNNGYEEKIIFGKIEYTLGNLDNAARIFRELIKNNSNRFEAYLNLGLTLVRAGDYKSGISYIDKALKINAGCKLGWYARAKALLLNERWNEAEKAYLAVLSMNRRDTRVWLELGIIYLIRGKTRKCIETLMKAKKLGTENEYVDLLLNLARYLLKRKI